MAIHDHTANQLRSVDCFVVWWGFISRSMHARLQVSVCSS